MMSQTFSKGEYIIKEGDIGDRFFIVNEGQCSALKMLNDKDQNVMDYIPGQYFGERALLMNEARAASIKVTSESCTVLSLDRGAF